MGEAVVPCLSSPLVFLSQAADSLVTLRPPLRKAMSG
jgi:hypothetical protein